MATRVLDAIQPALLPDHAERRFSHFAYAPGEVARMRAATSLVRCACMQHHGYYQWAPDIEDATVAIPMPERKMRATETFQPWAETGDVEYYCTFCDDYGCDISNDTFWCDACNRQVYDSNGMRSNIKFLGDSDYICVACWQADMLATGHPDEVINAQPTRIPCDFYNYVELAANGWEEWETIYGSECERDHGRRWRILCRWARNRGYYVLTDQGMTPIVGAPDSVTLWRKRED